MKLVTLRPAALTALAALTGCFSAAPPLPLRHFRPPRAASEPAEAAPAPDATPQVPLVLGAVTAAPWLRERMVWRLSDVEIAFDEIHRWAAPPAELVEAALVRALYGEGRFAPATFGPRLEVHVAAFERTATDAIVTLEVKLVPEEGPAEVRAVRSTAPIPGDGPADFAHAIGVALADAVAQVAQPE